MARSQNENEPVEVKWDKAPLDVSLERHGNKKPDRKVRVRGAESAAVRTRRGGGGGGV